MRLDSFLVPLRVVVVVQKPERALVFREGLKMIAAEVYGFSNLFEAYRHIQQRLAHLVMCDVQLPDGTVHDLAARLKADEILGRTSIMGLRFNKSLENPKEIVEQGIPVFEYATVSKDFLARLALSVHLEQGNASPYMMTPEDLLPGNTNADRLTIAAQGTILGKLRGQVVIRTPLRVEQDSTITAIPREKTMPPIALSQGSNTQQSATQMFNLFPARKAQGAGVKWLMPLPSLSIEQESNQSDKRRIIACGIDEIGQWKRTLSAYEMDVVEATSFEEIAQKISVNPRDFSVVWLGSDLDGKTGQMLSQKLQSIPETYRPNVVIMSDQPKVSQLLNVRYLVVPCGLSVFIDSLEAAMVRASSLANAQIDGNIDGAAIHVDFHLSATLIGFDEVGGVIQTSISVLPGAMISLKSERLVDFFDSNWGVQVTHVRIDPTSQRYQLRFEFTQTGLTPLKRIQALLEAKSSKKLNQTP
jgi:DNA-binding response OmpR family regulator